MTTPGTVETDEILVTEVEGGEREGGVSMDVLLQVTLPIVLILAFLVVTEVQTLTEEINRLQRDIDGTATGRLIQERDIALLELQEQLLYSATNEVGHAAEEELGLDVYAVLAPSIESLLAERVDPAFLKASREIHTSLGDSDARVRTEDKLRRAVEERFIELVDEQTQLDGSSRSKVLAITDVNRESFEIKLRGYIERFIDSASAAQLSLMLRWLRDPEASRQVEEESLSLWRSIGAALVGGSAEDERIEQFIDLKAASLAQRLERMGAPLLSRTEQHAGL